MIIHFSGMRYASAHGSWADPRQLLQALRTEGVKANLGTLNLDQACAQAVASLQQELSAMTDPRKIQSINLQIKSLNNPVQRQAALLDYQADHAAGSVDQETDAQVLSDLEAMKDTFPDWVWKEIVARTDLRLEVTEANWEKLTPAEAMERWDAENQHWREIMNAWERRDITAWRQEHELTLSLIVTRAVCNEIAEHIQHLRGIKPAAGLTAKPVWYIRQQSNNPQAAYFKRPALAADFKSGASILFLGWVDRKPNPWQIAHPLTTVNLLPVEAKPPKVNKRYQPQDDTWTYAVMGDEFIRTSQTLVPQAPAGPDKKQKMVSQITQQWLRWTHEATVIEVARMADGYDYVLTFETGQIGVNIRPLGRLANHWDVYVGYVPPAAVEPARLEEMLDRQSIVLPAPAPVPAAMPMAAPRGLPGEAYDRAIQMHSAAQLALECWQSLTPRQRQVVALVCQGHTTHQIVGLLHITPDTVQHHLSNALHRFGLHGRAALCQLLSSLDLSPWVKTGEKA
jgi:DNA-binding CsgD family transcriptional regulator